MKVSEAMLKVCPFIEDAFWIDAVGMQANTARNITCICGDCMAWQSMEEKKHGTTGCKTGYFEDNKFLKKTDNKYTDYGYCSRLPYES